MVKIKNSEKILAAHYEYDKGALYIKFSDNSLKRYSGVPVVVFLGLINTDSPDLYFTRNIDSFFSCEEVDSIPKKSLKVKPGEIPIWINVLEDKIEISFEDEKSFEIPKSGQAKIPYWVILKVPGSQILVEHIQAFVNSTKVDFSAAAWDGKNFRAIVEDDDLNRLEAESRGLNAEEEKRQLEERRRRRIEIAKRSFGIPV